jgi:Mn2+/Fe2+ NRAMP family transporter
VGLARKPRQAKAFYTTIAVATILGATMHLLAINPLKALVWSAVINGVVAVPVMALLMLMSARTDIMGTFVIERGCLVVGWLATALMFMASVAMLMSPS